MNIEKKILSQISTLIIYLSSELKIIYSNNKNDILIKRNRFVPEFQKLLEEKIKFKVKNFSFDIKSNDEIFFFDIKIEYLKNKFVLLIENFTELYLLKKKYVLVDKKNKLLFWNSLDYIATFDINNYLIFDINISFSKFFKKNRKEIIGKSIKNYLSEENNILFYNFIEDIKKLGLNTINDIKLNISSGDSKYFNGIGMIMDLEEENSIYINFRDITEYKDIQMRIIQDEKLVSLGTLATGVAHELSQPLAGINFFVQILNDELKKMNINSDSINEAIVIINKEIIKSNEIISNLKNLSRRPSFSVDETMNLNQIINDVVKFIKKSFSQEDITINLDLQEKEIYSKGNSNLLNQVIMNLLINGKDAMINSETKILTISTKSKKNFNYIIIQDTGTGISEDIIDKIFEPFYTTKEVGKGTGLGLSITYEIIKSFKGQITVKNLKPNGTEFIIELPTLDNS